MICIVFDSDMPVPNEDGSRDRLTTTPVQQTSTQTNESTADMSTYFEERIPIPDADNVRICNMSS